MKRAIFFVLYVVLSSVILSQNLIINPSLELWEKTNKPTGWTTTVSCLKDSVNVKSGIYSCSHFSGTSSTKNLGQTLAVTPDRQYRFSFFYKTETTGTEHGSRIWCDWTDIDKNKITDASAKLILQPSVYMKSDTWQQFSVDITSPANAAFFILEVRTYQNSVGYFDDFVFEENMVTYNSEINLQDISIYPNPAHDYLIISNIEHLQHIDIQNFNGINVWSSNFTDEQPVTIPVSGMAEGVYFIRLFTTDKVISRKFIKKSN